MAKLDSTTFDPTRTTIKIRGKLAKLRTELQEAGKAFDAAWEVCNRTHSKENYRLMKEAHAAIMELNNQYKAEFDKLNVRGVEKLEGTR